MHEALTQGLLLAAALASAVLGFGWLALAMDTHWTQLRGDQPLPPGVQRTLRVLGAAALLASLAFSLAADHASMAALVWVMALAAGALIVAFMLSWRSRWMAPLIAWAR